MSYGKFWAENDKESLVERYKEKAIPYKKKEILKTAQQARTAAKAIWESESSVCKKCMGMLNI